MVRRAAQVTAFIVLKIAILVAVALAMFLWNIQDL